MLGWKCFGRWKDGWKFVFVSYNFVWFMYGLIVMLDNCREYVGIILIVG